MNTIAHSEALAKGTTAVVKLGGRSVEAAPRLAAIARQGVHLVVVHGGGAQVTDALKAAGIEARFVGGLRVTDEATLAVAEPVFTHIGKTIAHAMTRSGAPAIALTGRDAGLIKARVKDAALGRVGTVTSVDAELLRHLYYNGVTPVVGPIAVDDAGALNVNADEVASAVARSLGARDLVLLTDVPGVKDASGKVAPRLDASRAEALIADGVASGGMVPKVRGALEALASGVQRVRIVDEQGLAALSRGEEAGTLFEGTGT